MPGRDNINIDDDGTSRADSEGVNWIILFLLNYYSLPFADIFKEA